jgi:hypothetical protein
MSDTCEIQFMVFCEETDSILILGWVLGETMQQLTMLQSSATEFG